MLIQVMQIALRKAEIEEVKKIAHINIDYEQVNVINSY